MAGVDFARGETAVWFDEDGEARLVEVFGHGGAGRWWVTDKALGTTARVDESDLHKVVRHAASPALNPFYVVWSPTGPYSPRVRHNDEPEARGAARSMARRHPGAEFFVLRATARIVASDFTEEDFHDDLPFARAYHGIDEHARRYRAARALFRRTLSTKVIGRACSQHLDIMVDGRTARVVSSTTWEGGKVVPGWSVQVWIDRPQPFCARSVTVRRLRDAVEWTREHGAVIAWTDEVAA